MSEYLVVIEHESESWGAYCPDLPGIGVVGATREEVEQLIREAISLHLDGLREGRRSDPGADCGWNDARPRSGRIKMLERKA